MNKINATPKARFSIAMPLPLQKATDEMAYTLGINRNAFINLAISTFIENKRIAEGFDSLKDGMLKRFDVEFEKMLKQSKDIVDKTRLK